MFGGLAQALGCGRKPLSCQNPQVRKSSEGAPNGHTLNTVCFHKITLAIRIGVTLELLGLLNRP